MIYIQYIIYMITVHNHRIEGVITVAMAGSSSYWKIKTFSYKIYVRERGLYVCIPSILSQQTGDRNSTIFLGWRYHRSVAIKLSTNDSTITNTAVQIIPRRNHFVKKEKMENNSASRVISPIAPRIKAREMKKLRKSNSFLSSANAL